MRLYMQRKRDILYFIRFSEKQRLFI